MISQDILVRCAKFIADNVTTDAFQTAEKAARSEYMWGKKDPRGKKDGSQSAVITATVVGAAIFLPLVAVPPAILLSKYAKLRAGDGAPELTSTNVKEVLLYNLFFAAGGNRTDSYKWRLLFKVMGEVGCFRNDSEFKVFLPKGTSIEYNNDHLQFLIQELQLNLVRPDDVFDQVLVVLNSLENFIEKNKSTFTFTDSESVKSAKRAIVHINQYFGQKNDDSDCERLASIEGTIALTGILIAEKSNGNAVLGQDLDALYTKLLGYLGSYIHTETAVNNNNNVNTASLNSSRYTYMPTNGSATDSAIEYDEVPIIGTKLSIQNN